MDKENRPLTFEELGLERGRPIWTKPLDSDDPGKWEICTPDLYDPDLYGVTWLAYLYEPEEEGILNFMRSDL